MEKVVLRVEQEQREFFLEAAQAQGLTLSEFILEATERAAKRPRLGQAAIKRAKVSPCSMRFRALCFETSREGVGYRQVGFWLASNVREELSSELSEDERAEKVKDLVQHVAKSVHRSAWKWFEVNLLSWTALIPSPQRSQFMDGVTRAWKTKKIATV